MNNEEANDKIKVRFIDNSNGQTIGVAEMTADQLPDTFSAPTTMHIQGDEWNVEEAVPENSIDFARTKSLVLKMRKVEFMDPQDIWFSLPTISNEFPRIVAPAKRTEYDIQIHEDDYRQNEFLNAGALPLVEQEFVKIRDIWENHSKKSDDYKLFKNCHARDLIGVPGLKIGFGELKALLGCGSAGQVLINASALEHGFALATKETSYFGVVENNLVTELCVSQWNENTINEIREINKTFNLLFVNWIQCVIGNTYGNSL